jgi:hypothetical protein
VLIASVADAMALEAEQDAARAAAERAADEHDRREREAAAAAASSGIASSTAAPSTANEAASLTSAAVDDDDVGFGQPRPTWIPWAAVGGVVAIVLFAFFAWPSDEPQADAQAEVDTPVEPEPKTEDSSLASAEVQPEEPTPVVAPPEEPAEPQEAAAAIPDLGGGDMDEPVELEGEADSADEAGAESEGSPDGAEAEALDNDTQDTKKSSSNRRSKPRSRNKSIDEAPKPDPLPNREPKQEGGDSAPELLSQAKSQLARGRAPEAYRLASASYAKRRSTAALQVMAKAGCRMGNQSKAKRAFDKLSVTERSGIRSECRKHGVKLGL